MSEPIRIGIVGARFAAPFPLGRIPACLWDAGSVVGITSQSAESREAFARQHGIKAFASFEELCEGC